ncbi:MULTISPECIES: hypothetical protein [Halorussus]|uniref:Uncharacterized protein n=2 Tax=Halorussus TaxID=1070314 RepID=A0A8U0HU31_9EURY|nr:MULTISPECIES: hypothetical protein [Halorussus]UPV74592.1 hypothetical protein M0R89_00640 [Halorussus limi]
MGDTDQVSSGEEEEYKYKGTVRNRFPDSGWKALDEDVEYPFRIELIDRSDISVRDREMHERLAENRRDVDEVVAEGED